MLFLAIQRHKAEDCPGREPRHLREMSELLSQESLNKKGLKFIDAYVDHSCMVQASGPDHVCAFVLEGDSYQSVVDAFRPFPVEVRPMVSWGKYIEKSE